MPRSPSRAEEDTQELPVASKKREPRRKERPGGFATAGRFRSLEAVALLLALISALVLLPLRGVLSPVPILLFLAAIALFLFPGLLVSYLIPDEGFSGVARLPIAFVLSTGLFGILAVPFLFLNRGFNEYFLVCGIVLILVLGFILYRLVWKTSGVTEIPAPSPTLTDLLWVPFAGLAATLAYVSAVMQEEPNGDSWIYLAYVRDYTNSDSLALSNPILGGQAEDSYLSFRTTINGWLMDQAALSRASGLAPADLVLDYLAPALVVLSLLAGYALARVLFGKGPALLVGSLTALLFLLDLQSTIPTALLSPGNDFVARVTEDKYVTRFFFLPVSLGLAVLYLRSRKLRYLAFFTFVCWSAVIVHPIGLILIGMSTAGLGFFHLIANFRDSRSWKAVLGLGAAIGSISVPPLLYLLATGSPLLSRLSDSSGTAQALIETWSASKRLLVLGEDSYIMHPALLLNPAVIAAYALGVSFVLFRLRRDLAAQLLLGVLVFTPLLIYTPPISTPLANIIGPWVLVRLSWPISLAVPLVLGWVIWEVLDYAKLWLERSQVSAVRRAGLALPILLVVILVAGTAPANLAAVRTANETGEIPNDQATCSDPVFRWMRDEITGPTTVLAPYMENSCIPAQNAYADVVTLRGLSRDGRVEQDLFQFYASYVFDGETSQFLRREGIGYVLLPTGSPLNAQFQHLPGLSALDNPGDRYKLYSVEPDALAETPATTANTLMNDGDLAAAAGYYTTALGGDANEQFLAYMGLGIWNMRQELYAEAAANYEQALAIDPENPSLYSLLSYAYNSAGNPDLARLALENGVDRFPENVELRTDLSALLMSQDPAAAVEVQREVVERFPDVPDYRISLGTYLSLDGDAAAADQQFERAIRGAPLSEQLHTDVGLANQTVGREGAAVRHYERALELNPNFQEARERLQSIQQ